MSYPVSSRSGDSNSTQSKLGTAGSRSKYVTRACQECRRRRAKCDGQKPSCSRCRTRQLMCIFATDADNRGSASRSYVAQLQNRIEVLENALHNQERLCRGLSSDLSTLTTEHRLAAPAPESCVPSHTNDEGTDPSGSLEGNTSPDADGNRFFGTTSGRLELQSRVGPVVGHPEMHVCSQNTVPQNNSAGRFDACCGQPDSEGLTKLTPDLVEFMVDVYFEWEQPFFQLVDRKLFLESRKNNGRYFSPLLLHCIIAIASRYTDRPEVRSNPQDSNTAGLLFLKHAEKLLQVELKWPSITTIQSLALMAVIYVAIGSDAAGWLHHGMAIRLVLDMGLNVDSSSVTGTTCLSPEDVQIRRQIYWALYCSDKLWATYTGRVCTMLDYQGSIPLPQVKVTGSKRKNAFTNKNDVLVSFSRELCIHCQILEKILTTLYTPKRVSLDVEKYMFFNSCLLTLRGWYHSLSQNLTLQFEEESSHSCLPHIFILHMIYHTSLILLARPFLAAKQTAESFHIFESQGISAIETSQCALSLCHQAARDICLLVERYRQTFGTFRRCPLTATHCNLTAILVNLFAEDQQTGDNSDNTRREIKMCLLALQELSDSWIPAKRYWSTLSRALGEDLQLCTSHQDSASQEVFIAQSPAYQQISTEIAGNRGNEHIKSPERISDASGTSHVIDTRSLATLSEDLRDEIHEPLFLNFRDLDFSALESLPWDYMECDVPNFGFT